MNLRQLRYAIAVAEEQHFTRAAQRLHITQSALSTQIRELERELGVTIFERSSRRFALTPAGKTFLDRAYTVMGTVSDLVNDVPGACAGEDARMRIGVPNSVHLRHLGQAVAQFHEQRPDVAVSVLSQSSDCIVADIESGSLDCGIIHVFTDSVPRGLSAFPLWTDRLGAFTSRNSSPLTGDVTMEHLSMLTVVDFPAGNEERAHIDQAFMGAGSVRGSIIEANSIDVIAAVVGQGTGVAILPLSMSAQYPDLVATPIVDAPRRSIYALANPKRSSSLIDLFVRLLASPSRKFGTAGT